MADNRADNGSNDGKKKKRKKNRETLSAAWILIGDSGVFSRGDHRARIFRKARRLIRPDVINVCNSPINYSG